jgi:hypothetical protein
MKKIGIILIIIAFIAALGNEWLWRSERVVFAPATMSPSGHYYAEVRSMPEGSILPYGTGVYVWPRWIPMRTFGADLVFVGYCRQTLLEWSSNEELHVVCSEAEGNPKLIKIKSGGVKLKYDKEHKNR